MSNQKIVTEAALSALASDIKNALSGKANSNDVYTKTEIDNALDLKADKSELYNVYPTDQESGAIASFTDGADNIPVKSLVSQITAVESGSGEKSPDNPYTISGFANGVITRCGKNLFNEIYPSIGTLQYMNIFVGKGKFTMSTDLPTRTDAYANLFFLANKVSSGADSALNGVYNNRPVTVTSTDGYVTLAYRYDEYNPENYHSQIEYGNQATTYEPYNGNTYTFTFGQTVYGGHFDNKGNLVVTHKIVDLGSVSYTYSASDKWFYNASAISNEVLKPDSNDDIADVNSEMYISRSRNTLSGDITLEGVAVNRTGTLQIRNLAYTDPALFKTAMSGVKLVYALATPITLSITSQDIPTLLGENNIFSNTGDVEVNYHADIGLYIDKKISSLAQA